MQPDILVSQLYMRVEPSDSSYMPSLVVVSGGESSHTMKELKTVNIGATDTLVLLLQDMTEVWNKTFGTTFCFLALLLC